MDAAGRVDVADTGYDEGGLIWHNPGGKEGMERERERHREVEVGGVSYRGVPEDENDCNHDGTLMDASVDGCAFGLVG